MKRLLLSVAAVILAVGANAQEKGNFWIGGNFGFESSEFSVGSKENTFIIAPEFGYQFSDRWGAGIRVGYEQTTSKSGSADKDYIKAFNIAPFARYTFLRWKALNLFADGGLSYTRADGEIFSEEYSYDELWSFGAFVRPGLSLNLSKSFSLVATANLFNFGYAETEETGDYKASSWAASLNSPFSANNITLGFTVAF